MLVKRRSALPLAAVILVGLALRTLVWWPSNNLSGVLEYDDGVYYAASRLLLDGYLPYRDFTIVHPPAVSLMLLPAAALGHLFGDPIGIVAGRVEMQLVAAINIVLVHRLAGRLPGDPATRSRRALVAAGLYAVMPNAVFAEHTILLEPLATCACLGAAWFLLRDETPTRADLFTSGFFLLAGVALKLFAATYILAVVGYLLYTRRPKSLVPLAGGGFLGAGVFIAPFVVLAPAAAWHDVVVTQLRRPHNRYVPDGLDRVADMVGLGHVTIPVALVLLALLAVITVQRFDPQVALWASVLVLSGLAFASSPTYFTHYGESLGPAITLLVSRSLDFRRGALLVTAFAIAFAIGSRAQLSDLRGQKDLRAATADIPSGACVYSDAVSLLLIAGVYTTPGPHCPSFVDGRGAALTQNTNWDNIISFYPNGFVADKRWQHANVEQMTHADYLLLRGTPATFPEWDASTRAYVLSHFTLAVQHHDGRQPFELWERTAPG